MGISIYRAMSEICLFEVNIWILFSDIFKFLSRSSHFSTRHDAERATLTNKKLIRCDSERELFTTTSSTTFTQCAPEATKFGEITQNEGHYAVQGHSRSPNRFWYQSKLIYDFLLVINSNLPHILHCFRDIAFDESKSAIFGYPYCVPPPTEGFPWDDLRKIFRGCQRMTKVPNGVETLPKISTGCVGRTNVTDRQTDRRRTGDSI